MLEIDYLERYKRLALLITLYLIWSVSHAYKWQTLENGLDYTSFKPKRFSPWSQLHVFKISLDKFQLSIAMAKEYSQKTSAVSQLAHLSHALIAINGGFFNPQYQPLGLRMKQGYILNPLKNISWWGILYIKNNKPYLVSPKNFSPRKSIRFAIQGGPRLLIKGKIPKLKPGVAERSAIAITKDNNILLVVTDHFPLSTTQLAEYLQALDCDYALNLDGGSSSQLYANIGDFKLRVTGFSTITDAVIVKKHENH
jgi:uncharacterized protein YigE (DUF2233 family)